MIEYATVSGARMDLLFPSPDVVRVEDCAHHLAWTCRYAGGIASWYNNAQHSVLVADIGQQLIKQLFEQLFEDDATANSAEFYGPPELVALACLAHDCGEPYTGDITNPTKRALRFIASLNGQSSPLDVLEARINNLAIEPAFGLPPGSLCAPPPGLMDSDRGQRIRQVVKQADGIAAIIEDRVLRGADVEIPDWLHREKLALPGECWPREQARQFFLDRYTSYKLALAE